MFIKNEKLYSNTGQLLKTISCPKSALIDNLQRRNQFEMNCELCNRQVLDADQFSENELETILKENPDTCLKINLLNPMFNQYEWPI